MTIEQYEMVVYLMGAALISVVLFAFLLGVIYLNVYIVQLTINHTKKLSYLVEYCYYRKIFKEWFKKNEGKRIDKI